MRNRQALQKIMRGYATLPKDAAVLAPTALQLQVYSVTLTNNTGGAQRMGMARGFNSTARKLYKYVDTGPVVTDVTASLDAGVVVPFFEANDDAIYVGSLDPSGLFGFTLDTPASNDGVYVYEYWNGSAWVTLVNFEDPDFEATTDGYSTFPAPHDWVAGDGGVTGLDTNLYYFRVVATTAPGTAPEAEAFWVGELFMHQNAIPANGSLGFEVIGQEKPFILSQGEGLIPYFASPNALNTIAATFNYGG